ncbi:MAG: ketoacyl-ACP synthase III [Bifidobacteriaceae bacterium]|jgi:3-oxoacyl-[acyl-carrier-protein] synthase-3|nr:ketoacyl-ACP synthase III [Bifidobacteriaceae bacterium]
MTGLHAAAQAGVSSPAAALAGSPADAGLPAGAPTCAQILAIDAVRGENLVPNEELIGPIDSTDEWIKSRTGITTRARANPEQDVIDLAASAATKVIRRAGLTPDQIDAVILATVTHFYQTPSAAAILAARIGAVGAAAWDISAACAGFCYGIAQADALVRSGAARHVLVIGAEKLSDFIDPADRTISYLLGDGAGGAIVGVGEVQGIGPTVWGTDGTKAELVGQTRGWLEEGSGQPTLIQQGPSVFRWAVTQMPKLAKQAMDAAGIGASDLAAFIPHQANMRIVDQLVKVLRLPDHVVVARDIAETGNTSAASVPLATERLLREGQVRPGGLALWIGFGAGLTYAAQVVRLPASHKRDTNEEHDNNKE